MSPLKLHGIRKRTSMGALKLVYGVPGTKEIYALRSQRLRLTGRNVLSINLLGGGSGGEKIVGYAEYRILKGKMYLRELWTMPQHRHTGVASALLAYLKTKKRPMHLIPEDDAVGFYKRLGFVENPESAYELTLPAGKPLAKREFEKKGRKFVIFAKPRQHPQFRGGK